MKIKLPILIALLLSVLQSIGQSQPSACTFWTPSPRNYEVKEAWEVESLFPMFLSGGYHVGLGYRYNHFRFRVSVINGGSYDAEPAGVNNSKQDFKRYYKTSPGFFVGYNIWRNLELYTYLELHTFEIEQKSSGISQNIHSTDFGGGLSYQLFLGRHVYLQPGMHIYLRASQSASFNGDIYHIPNVDLSPVIRIGYRFWSKY